MGVYSAITRGVAAVLGMVAPGADRRGPNGRWRPLDGDINQLAARDRRLIQARARQLVNDNPNVCGALEKIVANVVFTGIRPQAQLRAADGKLKQGLNNAVEDDFRRWAKMHDWAEQQQLALRHGWTDGGCLLHFFPRRDLLDSGVVPLGMELLPLDSLDAAAHGVLPNGNRAFQGIEIDRYGRPAAYHVREGALYGGLDSPAVTPDPRVTGAGVGESLRLPVSRCRMIMRRRRIGQLLPVSWMSSVIMTMHDLDEYQSAERIAARLAAAFGVFVILPQDGTGNDLSGNPLPALTGGVTGTGKRLGASEFVSQGRIDALPHGSDIKIAEHNRPGTTYEPYLKTTLRNASSGMGMSAAAYSNDYSDANFSSMRQSVLEERRGYRLQQDFLVTTLCEPVWQEFCAWRALFLDVRPSARADIPVRWQTPGWQWVDPVKDATAAEKKLQLCLTDRATLCAEQGLDFDDVLKAQVEETARLREAGLLPEAASAQTSAPEGAASARKNQGDADDADA